MSDKNGRPLKPDLRGSKQKFQSLTTTAFKSKQSLDQQGKGLGKYEFCILRTARQSICVLTNFVCFSPLPETGSF